MTDKPIAKSIKVAKIKQAVQAEYKAVEDDDIPLEYVEETFRDLDDEDIDALYIAVLRGDNILW